MLYKSLRRHQRCCTWTFDDNARCLRFELGRKNYRSVHLPTTPATGQRVRLFVLRATPPIVYIVILRAHSQAWQSILFFVVCCCMLPAGPFSLSLLKRSYNNNKWYYYSFALFHHSPPFCSVWGTNDAVSKYYQWWTSLFWAHHGWTRVVGDGRQWIDPSLRSFSPGENTTADYRGLDLPSIYCNDGQAKQFIIE